MSQTMPAPIKLTAHQQTAIDAFKASFKAGQWVSLDDLLTRMPRIWNHVTIRRPEATFRRLAETGVVQMRHFEDQYSPFFCWLDADTPQPAARPAADAPADTPDDAMPTVTPPPLPEPALTRDELAEGARLVAAYLRRHAAQMSDYEQKQSAAWTRWVRNRKGREPQTASVLSLASTICTTAAAHLEALAAQPPAEK